VGAYSDAETEAMKPEPQSIHEIHTEQLRRQFMKLPYEQKEFIRKCQGEGLEWKGENTSKCIPQLDGLTHFEHVYREWRLMKEVGVEEYKKRALAAVDSYERRSLGGVQREREVRGN